MEKIATDFRVITKNVDEQIHTCKESLEGWYHIMTIMNNTEEEFNRAWKAYGSISVILKVFNELRSLIFNQGYKRAADYIRFTVHQIERFTDSNLIKSDVVTGDPVIDAKLTIHYAFRAYLKILNADK